MQEDQQGLGNTVNSEKGEEQPRLNLDSELAKRGFLDRRVVAGLIQ